SGGVDHSSSDWVEEVRKMTPSGEGVDLVLDSAGRVDESVGALRPGGRCVVLGANVQETAQLELRPFYFGQYDLLGTTMGSPRDFGGLMDLIGSGQLPARVIDKVFPLEAAADAHRRMEAGEGFGRIVLDHK